MVAMWLLVISVLTIVTLALLFFYHPKVSELLHLHVQDRPRRRLLLAAVGFFFTIAAARAISYAAARNIGPFHYVYVRGTHVHHLVFGILLLLIVGFCWLLEVGTGARASSLLASRLMSLLYGVGAALTLDEFDLWLHLEESVYWTARDSVDAVLLFGAVLLAGIWGRDFVKSLTRELWQSRRRQGPRK